MMPPAAAASCRDSPDAPPQPDARPNAVPTQPDLEPVSITTCTSSFSSYPRLNRLESLECGLALLEGRSPLSQYMSSAGDLEAPVQVDLAMGFLWLMRAAGVPQDILRRPHERPATTEDGTRVDETPTLTRTPIPNLSVVNQLKAFLRMAEVDADTNVDIDLTSSSYLPMVALSTAVNDDSNPPMSRIRRIRFTNGDFYEGMVDCSSVVPIPHGRGRMVYGGRGPSGRSNTVKMPSHPGDRFPSAFEGDWVYGEWNGYGIAVYDESHPGAMCDVCGASPMIGLRRFCKNCSFDLCEACWSGVPLVNSCPVVKAAVTEDDEDELSIPPLLVDPDWIPTRATTCRAGHPLLAVDRGWRKNRPDYGSRVTGSIFIGTFARGEHHGRGLFLEDKDGGYNDTQSTISARLAVFHFGTINAPGDDEIALGRTTESSRMSEFPVSLYADAWQSVLSYCDLGGLHAALTVCRSWLKVIGYMPSLRLGYSQHRADYTGETCQSYHLAQFRYGDTVQPEWGTTRIARHVTRLELDSSNRLTRELMEHLSHLWPHLEFLSACINISEIERMVTDPTGEKAIAAAEAREARMKKEEEKENDQSHDDDDDHQDHDTHENVYDDIPEAAVPIIHRWWGYCDPDNDDEPEPPGPNTLLVPISPWPRPVALTSLYLEFHDPCFMNPPASGRDIGLALAAIFPPPLNLGISTETHADAPEWMQLSTHMLLHLPHITDYNFRFGNNNWTDLRRPFIRAIARLPRLRGLKLDGHDQCVIKHLVDSSLTSDNDGNLQPLRRFYLDCKNSEDLMHLRLYGATLSHLVTCYTSATPSVLSHLPHLIDLRFFHSSKGLPPPVSELITVLAHQCRQLTCLDFGNLSLPSPILCELLDGIPHIRSLKLTLDETNFSLAAFTRSSSYLSRSLVQLRVERAHISTNYGIVPPPNSLIPLSELHHLYGLRALRSLVCDFRNDWFHPPEAPGAKVKPSQVERQSQGILWRKQLSLNNCAAVQQLRAHLPFLVWADIR